MNYQFASESVSQHIVKYGVDIRPAISPEQDRTKLQDYGNWLGSLHENALSHGDHNANAPDDNGGHGGHAGPNSCHSGGG